MKFALILESSLQKSFSVRDKCAYKLGTNQIYDWHSSIRVNDEMTTMGPFAYPFIFEGDYLNWAELETLPPNGYDVIFCALEKHPDKYSVSQIRKAYPNAIIVGTVKELYFIKDYKTRIDFFNQCDYICVPYKDSWHSMFPDIKKHVNKPIHWLPQGYDVDFLYKNFYQEERTESFFSYIAPHPPRRANTEQYTNFLSQNFNIPLIRKNLTQAYDNQWHDFISLFSKSTFCINLDPEPQFGQQGVQCAILGVINIGGVNDSHFNLWPDTCHNNLDELTRFVAHCLDNPEYRFTIMKDAFEKVSKIYSFEAVKNKFNTIIT